MTFKQAVESTSGVAAHYQPGLRALSKRDAARIRCRHPRRLTGSIHVDDALRTAQPQANRWDYGIGIRRGANEVAVWVEVHPLLGQHVIAGRANEVAVWVEVHPASSANVADVLDKLRWLRTWLKEEAVDLQALTQDDFHWVSTDGTIAITPNSRQAKQLASEGLRGPVRVLNLM